MVRNCREEESSLTASLPEAVFASEVDALFSDAKSFAIGSAGACLAIAVVGFRTGSVLLLANSGLLCAMTLLRLWSMQIYARCANPNRTSAMLRRWERLYIFGATAHIVVIGSFCLITFTVTESPVDRLLSLATVLAYMTGIPGRNFANPAGVTAQIAGGGLPVSLAMFVSRSDYWLVAIIVLLPLFVALKGLSERLRGIFVQATIKAHDLSLLAARFDTALSNMSHGLAMFDRDRKLVVYNKRLIQLLALDLRREYVGAESETVFALSGALAGGERIAKLQACLDDPPSEALEFQLDDGSTLEMNFQRMPNGGVVVLVQEITERKRAENRIRQLARYDELTGMPNRFHFKSLMDAKLQAAGAAETYALLFIDLDQFKQVNDTLGHIRGDILLRKVADRLCTNLDDRNVIARFGGDEFVMLCRLRGLGDRALDTAREIIDRISKPYEVDQHEIVIGASVGIALFPHDDVDPDQLLKKADMALYAAKGKGRAVACRFEPSMALQARARRELEADLQQALRRGEFEVFFQPIFDMKKRRFTVCEALLRWHHPTRGFVSPTEFIPVAEEIGLIVEIGNWVLQQACKECAKWPDAIAVAVNISPLQFRRGDIVESVSAAWRGARLSPDRLELELTESVLLQDSAFASATMHLLNIQRVKISLDDFGTGYSSLSYIHKLPLSKVKIDRSFLAGLDTNTKSSVLLGSLTRLAGDLGLAIVVEGVETEEQLRLILQAADIDEVQGFLFSRPMPASDVEAFLLSKQDRLHTPRLQRA